MEKSICILMSTYNGEKYIKEQIDSILNQKHVKVEILIRDDGSSDDTINIIKDYANKNVRLYLGQNLGPAKSFLDLLRNAPKADYYAFSDQDDYWEEEKLIRATEKLDLLEQNLPALYYSNLKVVDKNLVFCRMAHLYPQVQYNKYAALLEFMPSGCTMVFNRAAVEYANHAVPKWCIMHDVWLYIICKMFGSTTYDFNGYILYRQHENNVIGTYTSKNINLLVESFLRLFDSKQQPKYNNAKQFYECYKDILKKDDKEKLLKIIRYKESLKNQFKLLLDNDFTSSSFYRDVKNKILILFRRI